MADNNDFIPSGSVSVMGSTLQLHESKMSYFASYAIQENMGVQDTSSPNHQAKKAKKAKKSMKRREKLKQKSKETKSHCKEIQLSLNEKECIRRKEFQKSVERLSAEMPIPLSQKLPLKSHLAAAIYYIKNLKFESSMLMAEKSWLMLENREAVDYLEELRDLHGTRGCKPKLWEDGRTSQDRWDGKWDAVQMEKKSADEMEVQEMSKYQLLEELKKQKMQLHAEYLSKTTDPGDAVRDGEMETGRWCSDRRCPAAPHRIHNGGGEQEKEDEPWWMASEEEDGDEDGGWVEDTDKMKLDGGRCPAESLHRHHKCSRNNPFTDVKRKAKHGKSKSKSRSGAPVLDVIKQEPVDTESTNDRITVPVKQKHSEGKNKSCGLNIIKQEPVDIESTYEVVSVRLPIPVLKDMMTEDASNGSSPDCSRVVASGHGKLQVIKLDPKDLLISDEQPLQLGQSLGKKLKMANPNHLDVHLIQLNPGKAVLVYLPRKPGDVNGVSGSTGVVGHGPCTVSEAKRFDAGSVSHAKDLNLPCTSGGVKIINAASLVHGEPAVTQDKQQVDVSSAKELDSTEGKTLADADATEVANKSSSNCDYSPMSCMLCDKPFDNVSDLQSHLIDSHAS